MKKKSYWQTHDPLFLETAKLDYFNKEILCVKGNKETDYIFNIIKDAPINSIILDIGAFNGDTGIYLATKLKNINRSDIKIYCFEPNLEYCKEIEKAVKENKLNIIIINKLLSNKQTTLYMKKFEGSGTMYDSCYNNNTSEQVKYESLTLDDLKITNIYFCKIDVEGHEPEVLEGGIKTLKNTKYIYLEQWNDKHFKKRHTKKLNGSHNIRILEQLKKINKNLYPIQKIQKNILYKNILVDSLE